MGGRPLVYDLIRTFVGPLFATPRGIDRVDFLLARHFSQDSRRNFFGILPTPWGMRVYEADRVQRGLARLEELWAETTEPANDLAYQNLVGAIAGRGSNGPSSPRNALGGLRRGQRMASLLAAAGFSFGRSAIASVPENAIYFNVGHYTLAMPQFLAWLDKRRDVKPVLMLHDTIPLDGPELVSPDSARHHATMVRSVARYGAGLIVTTAHARDTILRALAAAGRSGIRTLSIALPLAEAFDSAVDLTLEESFLLEPGLGGIDKLVNRENAGNRRAVVSVIRRDQPRPGQKQSSHPVPVARAGRPGYRII